MLRECPRRLYKCYVGCGEMVAVEEELHETTQCRFRILTCTLGRGQLLRFDRLQAHKEREASDE